MLHAALLVKPENIMHSQVTPVAKARGILWVSQKLLLLHCDCRAADKASRPSRSFNHCSVGNDMPFRPGNSSPSLS